MKGLLQHAVLLLIRIYQLFLSPLKLFFTGGQRTCRYEPTCSEYARVAVMRYGALRGGWLALKRVSRCHPWGRFGWDPVPEKDESKTHY